MIAHNVFSVLPCLLLGVALMLATPSSGAEIAVDWFIPTGSSLPSKTAMVGDTATFTWVDTHNVYVHPSGDCGEDGRILVGASTGAMYTFVEDDVGELVFACDISSHCGLGLIVTFTVSAISTAAPTSSTKAPSKSPSTTSIPTIAPTIAPTAAPSSAAPIISQSSTTAVLVALMVCTSAFAYAGLF
jgi:hypothetical protein